MGTTRHFQLIKELRHLKHIVLLGTPRCGSKGLAYSFLRDSSRQNLDEFFAWWQYPFLNKAGELQFANMAEGGYQIHYPQRENNRRVTLHSNLCEQETTLTRVFPSQIDKNLSYLRSFTFVSLERKNKFDQFISDKIVSTPDDLRVTVEDVRKFWKEQMLFQVYKKILKPVAEFIYENLQFETTEFYNGFSLQKNRIPNLNEAEQLFENERIDI